MPPLGVEALYGVAFAPVLVGWAYLALPSSCVGSGHRVRLNSAVRGRKVWPQALVLLTYLRFEFPVALLSCTLWIPSVYVVGTSTHGAGLP